MNPWRAAGLGQCVDAKNAVGARKGQGIVCFSAQ